MSAIARRVTFSVRREEAKNAACSDGRQMAHEIDIRRPWEILRILRAADQEAEIVPLSRRMHEQLFQRALAIIRIGAEIGQVGAVVRLRRHRMMDIGIDMAIERLDQPGTELVPIFLEQARPASETQNKIEASETAGADIGQLLACLQPCQRNRCIKIVKDFERA